MNGGWSNSICLNMNNKIQFETPKETHGEADLLTYFSAFKVLSQMVQCNYI